MSQNMATQIEVDELATLLVPLEAKQLLLPNVTVAEIIPYAQPMSQEDAPAWMLGYLDWRNTKVPMISFEVLNEEAAHSSQQSGRIAIFNGLTDSQRMPFLAVLVKAVPRQMRISSSEVSTLSDESHGPAEHAIVSVVGERASIPNLDYIEAELLKII